MVMNERLIARTSLTLWEGEDITNKDIGEKYVRKICHSQRMNQSWPSGIVTTPKATAVRVGYGEDGGAVSLWWVTTLQGPTL
jgi:hypothetical protein